MQAKYGVIFLIAAELLVTFMPGSGFAQSRNDQKNTDLLRQENIAPTGATVPLPGTSKSAGQTSLDTEIERHDDRISRTICSNC